MNAEDLFDVAVIGSGVAGALLADNLANDFKVVVIESGGEIDRDSSVLRYQNAVDRDLASPFVRWPWTSFPDLKNPSDYFGHLSSPYHPSFLKALGGTTWHWTGMTPRFLPSDFRMRSLYDVGVDWPLSYHDLEPYYLKAEHELGVSGDSLNDHGSPRSGPYPMPPIPMPYSDTLFKKILEKYGYHVKVFPAARNSLNYDDRQQCCGSNSCTPICPSGAQYNAHVHINKAKKKGALVLHSTTAFSFDTDQNKNIINVQCKGSDNSTIIIRAKKYIVACNAIESPRLLLMSALDRFPQGVANSSAMVGANLMDHTIFFMPFESPFPVYGGRGPQSVSAIMHGRDGEFRRTHSAVKLFLSNDVNAQSITVEALKDSKNYPDLIGVIREKLIHHACIGGEIEPMPSPDNRITLDFDRLDPLGLPLPNIQYHTGDYLNNGLQYWQHTARNLISLIGGNNIKNFVSNTSHHPSGTLRMGLDPRTSVVDRNCKTHDHRNLYVAGSSVFPTMGTANPTLTIAALSIRLANFIKSEFKE